MVKAFNNMMVRVQAAILDMVFRKVGDRKRYVAARNAAIRRCIK